jgi:hypothetical protein
MQNQTSNSTLVLLNLFPPIVGLVLTIAKYWNEIKTIALTWVEFLLNYMIY